MHFTWPQRQSGDTRVVRAASACVSDINLEKYLLSLLTHTLFLSCIETVEDILCVLNPAKGRILPKHIESAIQSWYVGRL